MASRSQMEPISKRHRTPLRRLSRRPRKAAEQACGGCAVSAGRTARGPHWGRRYKGRPATRKSQCRPKPGSARDRKEKPHRRCLVALLPKRDSLMQLGLKGVSAVHGRSWRSSACSSAITSLLCLSMLALRRASSCALAARIRATSSSCFVCISATRLARAVWLDCSAARSPAICLILFSCPSSCWRASSSCARSSKRSRALRPRGRRERLASASPLPLLRLRPNSKAVSVVFEQLCDFA